MSFSAAIVGAGPAGLYAAILFKRRWPESKVVVFEKNAVDATFGFGVVFSHQAMAFLAKDDPQTAALIESQMESWSDITVRHRGARIVIDGIGFSAIGRLHLLQLLQARAEALGVVLCFEQGIDDLGRFADADLVVGADGLNSAVRAASPEAYGEDIRHLSNRFVWYGATRPYPTLSQSFRATADGFFNVHHYRYTAEASTFLVECNEATYQACGLGDMSESESLAFCEGVFAEELSGAQLVANNSVWRRFPLLSCERWFHGNRVLVGDALHTAHFSIGSGTRLALEDVIALVRAMEAESLDFSRALPRYQTHRQPVLDKLTSAARNSAMWYEDFVSHMALPPWEFALSYIRRAGRLSPERLLELAPQFSAELAARGIEV